MANYMQMFLSIITDSSQNEVPEMYQWIEKYIDVIESFLIFILSAASPEARAKGRKSFFLWEQIAPRQAENLYRVLDFPVQKAIADERDGGHGHSAAAIGNKGTHGGSFKMQQN